jgi:hypothetical protein
MTTGMEGWFNVPAPGAAEAVGWGPAVAAAGAGPCAALVRAA